MKKLFTLLAVGGLAVAGQAAQLDWSYTATSADVGKTVYVLLGSAAVEEWESLDKLEEAKVDSAGVAKKGKAYGASGSFTSDKISKTSADVYYVVVDADGKTFGVTSVSDMTGSVYDPDNQESTPGANSSLSPSSITKSGIAWGTGGGDNPPGPGPDDPPGPGPDDPPTPGPGGDGDVPEPTSGILLMIGGAALALRRRR